VLEFVEEIEVLTHLEKNYLYIGVNYQYKLALCTLFAYLGIHTFVVAVEGENIYFE